MRKPPERKVMLAALVLLVAAGVMTARPAAGFAQKVQDLSPQLNSAFRKG
ncbi:MAG: hypothetical protein ACT4P4_17915 [Betaproteobacteria bacterium]